MEETVEKRRLSPGVLGLLALLIIGGILFIGNVNLTGQAILEPYSACCTLRSWMYSREGEKLASPLTTQETCYPIESPFNCCTRVGSQHPEYYPVKVIDAGAGACSAPQLSYPAALSYPSAATSYNSYAACCTVETFRSAPTGFIQGSASTMNGNCGPLETPNACCARVGAARSAMPIRVLGSKRGACGTPQVSYPAAIPATGFSLCCTTHTWRRSPIGYTQGTAETKTRYCSDIQTASQCCLSAASVDSNYPVRMLGWRFGACAPPEASYPIWIR